MHLRTCKHCQGLYTPCPRVKNQQYCSKPECQRARKRYWHKRKLLEDETYRANQEVAKRLWRDKHSDYWRQYRALHPEYVERNRKMQRNRNRRIRSNQTLQKLTRQPIAKMDALNGVSAKISGKYRLIPISSPGVAKMDALIVEINSISPDFAQGR
jgi:hypothetical protein